MRSSRALAVLLLVSCSGNGVPSVPQAARAVVTRSGAAMPLYVYVSDPSANDVQAYAGSGQHRAPIATITQGIAGPAGLTTDDSGNLYVANTTNNTVTEYARNGSSPIATYSQDVLGPVDVAVDDSGTLYVANFYSFVQSIVEFSNGDKSPSLTIEDPCSCWPVGLALDAQENLYVAYDYYAQTFVYKYAKGSKNGVSINYQFGQPQWEAAGLVFDKNSNLIAAVATLPGIEVFPSGQQNPSKTFGKRGSPRFAQLDPAETNLYVTDTANHQVDEYRYPSGKLTNTISSGLKSVYGIATSPRAPL